MDTTSPPTTPSSSISGWRRRKSVADRLVIAIIDNGRGIPADNQRRSGLANLRRRADLAGGQCQITTPPGGGTHVRWSAPYGWSWPESAERTGPD